MKKDFLKNIIDWDDDWIATVDEHFHSAFRLYKSKLDTTNHQSVPVPDSNDEYATFIANKRLRVDGSAEEEFVRY